MADERKPPGEGNGAGNRWRLPMAALIVVVMLGLVIYMTYRTGEIPYQIAAPLLGAALWALYNFTASGQGDGDR